jgi:hypothetical protein
MRKMTSLVLVVALLLSTFVPSFAAAEALSYAIPTKTIIVDDYVFNVTKTIDYVSVTYQEGNIEYTATLDKLENKVYLEVAQNAVNRVATEQSNNGLIFEVHGNSTEEKGLTDLRLIYYDEVSNNELVINIESEEQEIVFLEGLERTDEAVNRAAWVIPIGLSLAQAIVKALLAAGMALLIGNVAYIIASEAADNIRKQKTYNYYTALRQNNAIWIGNGISATAAADILKLNNSFDGVMAKTRDIAVKLTKGHGLGGFSHDEAHGTGDLFWYHLHPRKYPSSHLWYIT